MTYNETLKLFTALNRITSVLTNDYETSYQHLSLMLDNCPKQIADAVRLLIQTQQDTVGYLESLYPGEGVQ